MKKRCKNDERENDELSQEETDLMKRSNKKSKRQDEEETDDMEEDIGSHVSQTLERTFGGQKRGLVCPIVTPLEEGV